MPTKKNVEDLKIYSHAVHFGEMVTNFPLQNDARSASEIKLASTKGTRFAKIVVAKLRKAQQ